MTAVDDARLRSKRKLNGNTVFRRVPAAEGELKASHPCGERL